MVMHSGKIGDTYVTGEVTQESSISRDFNKRYAVILLLVVIVLVHLPSLISRTIWVEDNWSRNDYVFCIFLPVLGLYLMILSPIILLRTNPRLTAFDCAWFRWTRSELIRFPLLVLGVLLVIIVIYAFVHIVHSSKSSHIYLRSNHNLAFWIWVMITTTLLSPVIEEVFWRGYVQGTLERAFRPWISILLQAILFGLTHFGPTDMLRACLIGLVFGIWRYKRNTLLPIIIMHVINNSVAFAIRWPGLY